MCTQGCKDVAHVQNVRRANYRVLQTDKIDWSISYNNKKRLGDDAIYQNNVQSIGANKLHLVSAEAQTTQTFYSRSMFRYNYKIDFLRKKKLKTTKTMI